MKSPAAIVAGIIAGTILVIIIVSIVAKPKPLADGHAAKVRVDRTVLTVQVAAANSSRELGLGGTPPLDEMHGMLFIYDQAGIPTYWMKGVTYPIDIIWINGKTVTEITPNIPPPPARASDETLPRYQPTGPVDKVLEVKAGWVAAHSIQPGDPLSII